MSAASEIVTTTSLLDWVDLKHLHALTGQAESDFPKVIVKELVDNAIDAAEQAGRPPQVAVELVEDKAGWRIAVADNGPGLAPEQILQISDFTSRASSKDWRRATYRGQQGNAWKTILGIPVAYARARSPHARSYRAVEVETPAGAWSVDVVVDGGSLRAVIGEKTSSADLGLDRSNACCAHPAFSPSTRITCHLPADAPVDVAGIRRLLAGVVAVNPHLALAANIAGTTTFTPPSRETWKPQTRSSIHWYTDADFARLCGAARQLDWPVSRLITSLAGFTAKPVVASVLADCRFPPRARMADLTPERQAQLLNALRDRAPTAGPEALAPIGRSRLSGGDATKYAKVEGAWTVAAARVPFIIEATLTESNACHGEVITAINYSPTYLCPWPDDDLEYSDPRHGWFQGAGLNSYLASFHVDGAAPVRLVLHLACPRLNFRDRGKSVIESTPELRAAVSEAVWRVAHSFHRREEAHRRQNARAQIVRTVRRSADSHFTELAPLVIPAAYATAAGSFPFAFARQIFYKARPLFQRHIPGKELQSRYFTQKLLPDFLRDHPELTAGWTVLHDARGHLWEPHGGATLPLGTEDVDAYLHRRRAEERAGHAAFRAATDGPGDRYGTVLFIEKEGFRALLEDSGLLDEFDVALMSTKGISTTAARRFLQGVQGKVTLLALHDFDVAGMSIVGTLSRDTERFQFEGARPEVIDAGLRLDDVRTHNLPFEVQALRGDVGERLYRNGATDAEVEFLGAGKRVELNAFGNDEFVAWVRSKLEQHARKVVPPDEALVASYRDAVRHRLRVQRMAAVEDELRAFEVPPPPADLRARLEATLAASPLQPWDGALWHLVGGHDPEKRR